MVHPRIGVLIDDRTWGRWCLALFIGLLILLLGVFLRSTPDAFPYGDVAVIEITTLQALRGFVRLGPYSQFGWHHPGPLCFYLLAPWYALAGERSIGMTAGALMINLGAFIVMGWVALRTGGRIAAAILMMTMALYLLRADGVAASSWNAHLIIIPSIALTVLCAAVASGSGVALLAAAGVASFVMQTDIAIVPTAAVLLAAACVAAAVRPGEPSKTGVRSRRFWIVVSSVATLALWLPPILDQWASRPGNVTRLWRFFVIDRRPGPSWTTAFLTWADAITAATRPGFAVAWGSVEATRGSWMVGGWAVLQVVAVLGAGVWAWRSGHRFLARLCTIAALASLAACWSTTRIVDDIGDYQVFWMSALGALSWAALGIAGVTMVGDRIPQVERRCVLAASLVAGVLAAVILIGGLAQARAGALEQRELAFPRKLVAVATEDYLVRDHVRRPLFRVTSNTWLEAAGVILQVYKHHRRIAVEERWISMFGEALAPNGREDADLQFTRGAQPGDRLIAEQDGLVVHLLRRD